MTKQSRRNYIRALSQRKEHKKLHKVRSKWVAIDMSALVLLAGAGLNITTNAHASANKLPSSHKTNITKNNVQSNSANVNTQKSNASTASNKANNASEDIAIASASANHHYVNNPNHTFHLQNSSVASASNVRMPASSNNTSNNASKASVNSDVILRNSIANHNVVHNSKANSNYSIKSNANKANSNNKINSQVAYTEVVAQHNMKTVAPNLYLNNSNDNSSSLITNLINIVNQNVDNSGANHGNAVKAYNDLLNIISPINLHTATTAGIKIGHTNDNASNNTWMGYINNMTNDINTINQNGNNSNLKNLSNKLNNLSSKVQSNAFLINILGNTKANTSFLGDRLSNPGTRHNMVKGMLNIPETDMDKVGGMVDTLDTVLHNSKASTDYGHAIDDLRQLPGENRNQEKATLNDVATHVNNIASNDGITSINNEPNKNALNNLKAIAPSIHQGVTTGLLLPTVTYPQPSFANNSLNQLMNTVIGHGYNLRDIINHVTAPSFRASAESANLQNVISQLKNLPQQNPSTINSYLNNLANTVSAGKFNGPISSQIAHQLHSTITNIVSNDNDGNSNILNKYADQASGVQGDIAKDIIAGYNNLSHANNSTKNAYAKLLDDVNGIAKSTRDADGKNATITSKLNDIAHTINDHSNGNNLSSIGAMNSIGSVAHSEATSGYYNSVRPNFSNDDFNNILSNLMGSSYNIQNLAQHLASNQMSDAKRVAFRKMMNDAQGFAGSNNVNDFLADIKTQLGNFHGVISNKLQSMINNIKTNDPSGSFDTLSDYVASLPGHSLQKEALSDLVAGHNLIQADSKANTAYQKVLGNFSDMTNHHLDAKNKNTAVANDLQNISNDLNNDDNNLNHNFFNALKTSSHQASHAEEPASVSFGDNDVNNFLKNLANNNGYGFQAVINHLISPSFKRSGEKNAVNNILNDVKNIPSEHNINDLLNNVQSNLGSFHGPLSSVIANHLNTLLTNVKNNDNGGDISAIADYANTLSPKDKAVVNDIAKGYDVVEHDGHTQQNDVAKIINKLEDIDNQNADANGRNNQVTSDLNDINHIVNNDSTLKSQTNGLVTSLGNGAHAIAHNYQTDNNFNFNDNFDEAIAKLVGQPYTLTQLVNHLASKEYKNSNERPAFDHIVNDLKNLPSYSNVNGLLTDIKGQMSNFHGPLSSQIAQHMTKLVNLVEANDQDGNPSAIADYADSIKISNPVASALIQDMNAGFQMVKHMPTTRNYEHILNDLEDIENQQIDADNKNSKIASDLADMHSAINEDSTLGDNKAFSNLADNLDDVSNNYIPTPPYITDNDFNENADGIINARFNLTKLAQGLMSKSFKSSGKVGNVNNIISALQNIPQDSNINTLLSSVKNNASHFSGSIANYVVSLMNEAMANDNSGNDDALNDYGLHLQAKGSNKGIIIQDIAGSYDAIQNLSHKAQNDYKEILNKLQGIEADTEDNDGHSLKASEAMTDISNIINNDNDLQNGFQGLLSGLKADANTSASQLMPTDMPTFKNNNFNQVLNNLASSYNVYQLVSHLMSNSFKRSGEIGSFNTILNSIKNIPSYNNINNLMNSFKANLASFHGPVSKAIAQKVTSIINDTESNDNNGNLSSLADYANGLKGSKSVEGDLINDLGAGYQLIYNATPQTKANFAQIINDFEDIERQTPDELNENNEVAQDLAHINNIINNDSTLKNHTNGLLQSLANSAKTDSPKFIVSRPNGNIFGQVTINMVLNTNHRIIESLIAYGNPNSTFNLNDYDSYVPQGYIINGKHLSDSLIGSNVNKFNKGNQVVNVEVAVSRPNGNMPSSPITINMISNTSHRAVKSFVVYGQPNSSFNINDYNSYIPQGYAIDGNNLSDSLIGNNVNRFSNNKSNQTVNIKVAPNRPNGNVALSPITINMILNTNHHIVKSFIVYGEPNSTFNLNDYNSYVPQDYAINGKNLSDSLISNNVNRFSNNKSNQTVNIGVAISRPNGNHVVPVKPISPTQKVTDIIKFMHGINLIRTSHLTGVKGTTTNIASYIPSGYIVHKNDKTITFDGNTHTISLGVNRPNGNMPSSPITINMILNTNHHIVRSFVVYGNPNSTFNLNDYDSYVPQGYVINGKHLSDSLIGNNVNKFSNDKSNQTVNIGVAVSRPNGNHVIPVTPINPSTNQVTDTFNFVHGNNTLRTVKLTGTKSTSVDVSSYVPTGYEGDNTRFTYDGNTHTINLGVSRPNGNKIIPVTPVNPQPSSKSVTDVINFICNRNVVDTILPNGKRGTLFNLNTDMPKGYSLVKGINNEVVFDGRVHNIAVTSNAPSSVPTVTDTVIFMHGNSMIGDVNSIIGHKGSVINITNDIPKGYIIDSKDNNITLNGTTHRIAVGVYRPNGNMNVPVTPINPQPNQHASDVIDFIYNNNSIKSTRLNGLIGQIFDISNRVPSGYRIIEPYEAEVTLDNGFHAIAVNKINNNNNNHNNHNHNNSNMATDTINYLNVDNGNIVYSKRITGLRGYIANVYDTIPSGYQLADYTAINTVFDGNTHYVGIKPINNSNNNNNNNGNHITPNKNNNHIPSDSNLPIGWWDSKPIVNPTHHNSNNKKRNHKGVKPNNKRHHNIIKPRHRTAPTPIMKLKIGHTTNYHHMKATRLRIGKIHYVIASHNLWLHNSLNFHMSNHVATLIRGGRAKLLKAFVFRSKSGNRYVRIELKIGRHKLFANYQNLVHLYIHHKRGKFYVYAKRTIGEHTKTHFLLRNITRYVRKHAKRVNRILRVRRVVRIGKYDMTRLQLTNGKYITANKDYVKIIK